MAARHFEEGWGGFLPATAEALACYLAAYGSSLSLSTLKLRLASLEQWHTDQGFHDPTMAPLVRQVLKGIGMLHPARERLALPLPIAGLVQIDATLVASITREPSPRNLGSRH